MRKLKIPILAGPYHKTDMAFAAGLFLMRPHVQDFWFAACKPGHAELQMASRMLALLALQQDHPLLHPVLVPTAPAPACAFFLPSGLWSDHRGIGYPPEIRSEVDRLAGILRTDHPNYVADFLSALEGQRPTTFGRLPANYGLTDPADEISLVPAPPELSADEAALGLWGTEELFQNLVMQDYRKERYLEQATDSELNKRAIDAVASMHDLEGEHILLLDLAQHVHQNAFARLGEVMEEVNLRRARSGATAEVKREIPKEWIQEGVKVIEGRLRAPDRTRRALDWIKNYTGPLENALVRYDRPDHSQEALKKGRFRLAPASQYDSDPSLNRAQTASELVFEHRIDTKRARIELWDEARTKKLADIPDAIRPTITRRAPTDALVLCLSTRFSARLFHDFDRDACLFIHDRAEFIKRLARATASALPDWDMMAFNLRYIDEYSPEARKASPLINKPASYEYQCEYRILWLPPRRMKNLMPVFVECGPIQDIAEIVRVDIDPP